MFAEYVKRFSEETRQLGPFDAYGFERSLSAMETVFSSSRLRWLMGMSLQVTKQENVYGERLEGEDYNKILVEAAEQEYQKALILEALKGGPQSVREISMMTGFPVYDVSRRLGDLEKSCLAAVKGYDGTTPLFSDAAA